MGRYTGDDPEQKDASLFPESRVRPWVVDNDTERQVEDALDTLEKALTCLSPVKDGLGSGPLDHVHRDDPGVEMFLANMADLKAQERARESSSPGGGDQLPLLGEMLEKFYRENMAASVESIPELAFSEPVDNDEEDVLVNDPDVARLLAEMGDKFNGECNAGPESEATGEEGGTEDRVNAVGQENSPREGEATSAARRQRHHDENGLQQGGSSCGIDGNGWRKIGQCRGRGGQNDGGTAHLGHREISTAAGAAPGTQSPQGSIDISRIRIDGLGGMGRSEHRSCSVPSVCLSVGGCSRLSRTSTMSSQTLARAASQKLLEATKEAEEQASADHRKNGAVETPHRAASSAIAKADERIDVVRQNAEALQDVVETDEVPQKESSPPSRRLASTRDPFPASQPYSCRRRKEDTPRSRTTATDEHQSQQSMTAEKRRGLPCGFRGSLSTPLLSDAEAAFVLGTKEDEVLAKKAPSLRQTTLGRMLRRAASLSSVATSSPRSDASEHSSLYSYRPSTVDKIRDARSSGGGNRGETLLGNALRVNSAFGRPPSTATVGQEPLSTGRTRSSATTATHRRKRRPHAESPRHGTPIMISPFSERETSAIAKNISPKDRFHGGQGTASPRRTGRESAVRKRLPRSVHKALEAALLAASVDTAVSPQEQFVTARKTIADMKRLNTRDSIGDLLVTPALLKQGASESSLTTECWSTETGHRYR